MSAAVAPAAIERLDALAAERGIELVVDRPLGPLTTLRVGGPAQRFVEAGDRDALLAALRLAREAEVPAFVLGNGSDLVVSDRGIGGLVVRNRAKAVDVRGTELSADAGAPMAMLVKRCITDGLAGFEFGISIPGTLGGAVWANAGAHGGEIRDVLVSAAAWDPATDAVATLRNADCAFAYRESRFKHSGEVVLGATLRLERGEPQAIRELVDANQAQRRATQPLADQNAGSVFRNPPGDHAGRLIDVAGLKGRRIGSAEVSTLHANFILADRGGRAADVRALGDLVRATVADRFGITLDYEIEFVGDWSEEADA
ncbi:MAG TPA: UDP-N-acetylmuramate dehydrogenase [Candidatus Limnocylindria bacterium]